MTDQLTAAIAEVKRELNGIGPWRFSEVHDIREGKTSDAVDCVLNAAASGAMIPLDDHKLAVAESLRMAAALHDEAEADEILALADTDALAEVLGMRADIATLRACAKEEMERAEAAEAKLAALVEAGDSLLSSCRHFYYGSAFEKEFADEIAALAAAKGGA